MIRKLTFQNYKSFKNTTEIEIKPITVFVGPNSSGKSSILGLIDVLVESITSGQNKRIFDYNAKSVNLGNFDNICNLTSQPQQKKIPICLEVSNKNNITDKIQWLIYPNKEEIIYSNNKIRVTISDHSLSFAVEKNYKKEYLRNLKTEFNNYKDLIIQILVPHTLYSELSKASNIKTPRKDKDFDLTLRQLKKQVNNRLNKFVLIEEAQEDRPIQENINYIINDKNKESLEFQNKQESPNWSTFLNEDYSTFYNCLQTHIFSTFNMKHSGELKKRSGGFPYAIKQCLKNPRLSRATLFSILNYIKSHPEKAEIFQSLTWRMIDLFINERLLQEGYQLLQTLLRIINCNIGTVTFLGPLRPSPERSYPVNELVDKIIGREGLKRLRPQNYHEILQSINSNLLALGMKYDLSLSLDQNFQCSLLLTDLNAKTSVNYADVGFGFSQLLPILFAIEAFRFIPPYEQIEQEFDSWKTNLSISKYMSQYQQTIECYSPIVIIEQPELHLHPLPQARLAEIFTKCIYSSKYFDNKVNSIDDSQEKMDGTESTTMINELNNDIAKIDDDPLLTDDDDDIAKIDDNPFPTDDDNIAKIDDDPLLTDDENQWIKEWHQWFNKKDELALKDKLALDQDDLLIDQAPYSTPRLTRENQLTLIIETHSEHLVRGFQVMIAEGKLAPPDIAVYYIDKDDRGFSFVKPMPIDLNGSFTELWPDGFFDQGYIQALKILAGGKR